MAYPRLTSLIRLMKASLFSFAFLLKLSPFNPSLRNCSRSETQNQTPRKSFTQPDKLHDEDVCEPTMGSCRTPAGDLAF